MLVNKDYLHYVFGSGTDTASGSPWPCGAREAKVVGPETGAEAALPVDLTILVGTMTGTAELCAEEIGDVLAEMGHEVEIQLMDGLDCSALEPAKLYLVCTSTYGQGDVPDNAMQLYEDLQAKRPDLTGLRYGLVALGDRTYAETFTHGGKRFDEILQALSASRLGEVFQHDASSGTIPEEEAAEWARTWAGEHLEAAEAAA